MSTSHTQDDVRKVAAAMKALRKEQNLEKKGKAHDVRGAYIRFQNLIAPFMFSQAVILDAERLLARA